jgi:uroporphyrinogen decarboxylase
MTFTIFLEESMNAYTGRQRVKAAFKGQYADVVPAYPILGQFTAQLIGVSIKQFLTEKETLAEAEIAAYERYRPDIIVVMGNLLMEAEAMGNELKFPDEGMCISKKMALEDKGKLNSLSVPDPSKDGRLPDYMDACRMIKDAITDSSVGAVIAGPWTIAIALRGASELIRDAMKDPAYVHELMELTTEVAIRFGLAIPSTGAGMSYSEAPASASLISPKMYREFVFPYQKKAIGRLKEEGINCTLHI